MLASPRVTLDGVVSRGKSIALVRRANEPFRGRYALPGGFLEFGERLEDAVEREVHEETGLLAEVAWLLGVYGDPGRDPRGHTISVAYVLRPYGGTIRAGTDAASARFVPLSRLPRLAFDHDRIVADYRRSLRARSRGAAIVPGRGPGGTRSRRGAGRRR